LLGTYVPINIIPYYPPSWARVREWWGFEFLKSQIPHQWGTKSIQIPTWKVGYSAVVNFMNCQKPHGSNPPLFPREGDSGA